MHAWALPHEGEWGMPTPLENSKARTHTVAIIILFVSPATEGPRRRENLGIDISESFGETWISPSSHFRNIQDESATVGKKHLLKNNGEIKIQI